MKKLVIGILAHVDAGKTTLSEALLYLSGSIRRLGRVDHQDSFLDMDVQERERGITIFSKQARFMLSEETEVTLLDTPGHVDFSSEMERTLQVLDYAILVISASDGVQSHTITLWRLLQRYHIPTFLFINKMDLGHASDQSLMDELHQKLSEGCVSYDDPDHLDEAIATLSEQALDMFLSKGTISKSLQRKLIWKRLLFPCFFGSALKLEGVEDFMRMLDQLTQAPEYPSDFGAKVFKITYDPSGERLTHMKVTGGRLQARDSLQTVKDDSAVPEKVNQIRLYSGNRYETVTAVDAGTVCVVTGLQETSPGQGLGIEKDSEAPMLDSFITYQVISDTDIHLLHSYLMKLEQEDPSLHVVWDEELSELHVQLMGEIQLEVIQRLMKERFHTEVSFGPGSIVYRETIQDQVEGVGHFEPLRHYAEVHLLLEGAPRGSGLSFESKVSEDLLAKNWQRLIFTHLNEKVFKGVLTGSPVTDMKISIVGGRAHLKHTEGGDFRQATYRAVRQGLMQAKSILLEPYYDFELTVPEMTIGRAMTDLEQRFAKFEPVRVHGGAASIQGYGPVSTLMDYPMAVSVYTKGEGSFICTPRGYDVCHNPEEVIEKIGYRAEDDLSNSADSVFCSHGAGFIVPWYDVPSMMHVVTPYSKQTDKKVQEETEVRPSVRKASGAADPLAMDKELLEIFERTYGKTKKDALRETEKSTFRKKTDPDEKVEIRIPEAETEYLLVDGYNVIFAWEKLKKIAKDQLESARNQLLELLSAYQTFRDCILIVVFDAYNVPRPVEDILRYDELYVVYTRQAETADTYIERTTYELRAKRHVRVVTSDGAEQLIVLGHGAVRVSAREFEYEIREVIKEIREKIGTWNMQENKDKIPLDQFRHIQFFQDEDDHGKDVDHHENNDSGQ
ncbi:MAG: TetM/TetW/TetO/TetS family tetracycline resistance ribosomal protection protein [Firmicutes bacterium]|nr:TetM/TetW/TetO/TetS family tetracycline resistance ribosomal protection protein [Bacillota bacterium]